MSTNRATGSDGKHPPNYLRSYRKRTGLSQRELGLLLKVLSEASVSRHEQSKTEPSLRVAIGYEIIFKAPVSVLFHGTKDRMESIVNKQLLEFEEELHAHVKKTPSEKAAHRKLAWIGDHRNTEQK